MALDAKVVHVGGGSYDLDLVDTEYGLDLQAIGGDSDTHAAATAQRMQYEFGVWLGESPFDRSAGFPWEQAVFGRGPIEGVAELVYTRALAVEGVDDVESMPEMFLNSETRVLTMTMPRINGADFVIDSFDQTIQG